jgi:hypothetical protein
MRPVPISLAVEDSLSEVVLKRILQWSKRPYAMGPCYGKRGRSYLQKSLHGFNRAAKGTPILVLADLNADECAPALIRQWLSEKKQCNLILRIAVREIESWLLADREGLTQYLHVIKKSIPIEVEKIEHPKEFLIRLAKSSRSRTIREDLVPRPESTATVGPNYNTQLIYFVERKWDIPSACRHSDSLERTVRRLREFSPIWDS